MNATTHENLSKALHDEAFAYARYMLFAEQARAAGDLDLAEMLEGIGVVELKEHFFELAQLAKLVGADEVNLQTAIQDESAEVEETYKAYAEQARKAGEIAVAERFEEICGDELEHLKALETALERLEVPA
jgi:rubrerythrin